MAHDSRQGGAVGGAAAHRGEVARGGGVGHGSESRRDVPRESVNRGTSEGSRAPFRGERPELRDALRPGEPASPSEANTLRAPGSERGKGENRPGDEGGRG